MKGKVEELTMEELNRSLEEAKVECRKLRFTAVTGKLENIKKIRELKRHIARILTVKREYELGIRAKRA